MANHELTDEQLSLLLSEQYYFPWGIPYPEAMLKGISERLWEIEIELLKQAGRL